MDNLSELNILFRIVLPNIKAAIVSLGILLFINGWNEYIWAMLVSASLENAPVQIGLQQFMSSEGNEWGPLMAAATLSGIPIMALYLLLRKQIINSFVKWGIK
jgi:ABC-type glycerol-3-phosphate transport system permease component